MPPRQLLARIQVIYMDLVNRRTLTELGTSLLVVVVLWILIAWIGVRFPSIICCLI